MSEVAARVGLVGLGYWGANIARNLARIEGCQLAACCDVDPGRAERWRAEHPELPFATELDEVLDDAEIEAVAIATPVPTHAAVAARSLAAGKHCFVEKPLARCVEEAERVAGMAEERGLTLMVGHLLEYHPGIEALRALVQSGELGRIHYVHSQRLNLGKLRADENALWSLGAHDVSVLLALLEEMPATVCAHGESYVRDGVEDVVFCHLKFPSGVTAHLHLSWLDPHKERRLTVVGSRRMATFDDMVAERKLSIFDKGFDPDADLLGEYVARSGEVRSPAIPAEEPLRVELEHFAACVREGGRPRSDGASGVRVVRVLEALQGSLADGGRAVGLEAGSAAG